MSSSICSHLCINETPFQAVRQPTSKTALSFPDNSRWTKQSFKAESDINTIMARYLSTGELPNVSELAPQYLDVSGFDYQNMQNQVIEAQSLFMALPSTLRTRFNNDPGLFIQFCGDPANRAEMHKLGLLRSDYQPAIQAADAADTAPSSAA